MKLNTVVCGDNVDIMDKMPAECVDLTVTSPPYDAIRKYEGFSFDLKKVARHLYRITKPGGVVVWVVSDQITDGSLSLTSFKQAICFTEECGFNFHDNMVYLKISTLHGKSPRYAPFWESMFIFSKGKPKTFKPIRAKTLHLRPMRISPRHRKGSVTKMKTYVPNKTHVVGNVWQYNNNYNSGTKDTWANDHPAIFPEALAEDHINSWSNKGDLVFDPFCGSGTTLKVAKKLNRKFYGCDISEKYVHLSLQRVRQANGPLDKYPSQKVCQ